MARKNFSVVFFFQENRYSLVPSNWLIDTEEGLEVAWPGNKKNKALLIRTTESLPDDNWKKYPVHFIKSYDSYDRGCKCCDFEELKITRNHRLKRRSWTLETIIFSKHRPSCTNNIPNSSVGCGNDCPRPRDRLRPDYNSDSWFIFWLVLENVYILVISLDFKHFYVK